MSSSLNCPHCSVRLRIPSQVAGKSIQCPKCSHIFSIPQPDEDVTATLALDGNNIPGLHPRPSLPIPLPPSPPRQRPREQSNPLPLPPPRPTRSSNYEMGEDYETPSRPRRKSSSSKGVWLIVSLAAFLLIGVVVLVLLLAGGRSIDREMLAWVPADSNFMAGVDVENALNQKSIREFVDQFLTDGPGQEMDAFFKEAGLHENDVSKCWFAMNFPLELEPNVKAPEKAPSMCMIIKLKSKKFDPEMLRRNFNAAVIPVGSKSYYRHGTDTFFHFPHEGMVVLTNDENTMERLLTKGENEIVVYGSMRDLAEQSASQQFWVAMAKPKVFRYLMDVAGLKQMVNPQFNLNEEQETILRNAKGASITGGLEGKTVSLKISLACDSSTSAARIVELFEASRDFIRKLNVKGRESVPAQKLFDNSQASSKGEIATISFKVELSVLEELGKGMEGLQGNQGLPFNPGGLQFPEEGKIR